MPEAWDLAPDTVRRADEIITFILFCEDEVNEPSYFRTFQKPGKVKVNVVENQCSNFKNVINTLVYCEQNGILEKTNKKYSIKTDVTRHIWSVFDRDINLSNEENLTQDNLTFTTSIQTAEQSGIQVAWSNDVFELWILLHFEDVIPATAINRIEVYRRLTEIFRSLPGQSPEMLIVTSRVNFNYKHHLKKRVEFNLYVKPLLAPRLSEAMERAEALERAFDSEYAYHEMNPCTKIHTLVRSLQSFH